MTRLLILFLCLASSIAAQTPDEFASGLVLDDEVYDTLQRQAAEDGGKADLPATVDLSIYCPEVRHQGYIFSCVGWAVGYGAMSMQRAILNCCTDQEVITRHAHSALFLYNQIKTEDCRKGSRISDAMQFLHNKGDCLSKQFDFDVNNCDQLPDSAVAQEARRFSIQDFMTLFGGQETPERKVDRVKRALALSKPVVIGMLVLRNFYDLKNAQYWHPELGSTTPAGGHALVVVGYDDRRGAFRLFNSWGKNWGDGGFIWVKYKDFGAYCKYAYVMYLLPSEKRIFEETATQAIPEKPLTTLSGQFEFRAFTGFQEQSGQALFESAGVVLDRQTYRLQRAAWPLGQRFQLLAATLQNEQYMYVFSVDARREVHFHWPRQAGLNEKFAGQNESGLLFAGGAEVVVPGPNKVLTLANPGADRLVVLFSKQKIETVQKLAEIVSHKDGDFTQNLWQILGKFAVPQADVTFRTDRIGFEAKTRSDGYIVPLVLEVMAQE